MDYFRLRAAKERLNRRLHDQTEPRDEVVRQRTAPLVLPITIQGNAKRSRHLLLRPPFRLAALLDRSAEGAPERRYGGFVGIACHDKLSAQAHALSLDTMSARPVLTVDKSSTSMSGMDRWTLIEQIGAELGVKDEARRKWRTRGVSHKHRLVIAERARARGVELQIADFDAPAATEAA